MSCAAVGGVVVGVLVVVAVLIIVLFYSRRRRRLRRHHDHIQSTTELVVIPPPHKARFPDDDRGNEAGCQVPQQQQLPSPPPPYQNVVSSCNAMSMDCNDTENVGASVYIGVRPPASNPLSWTTNEVTAWLVSLDSAFATYVPTFGAQMINGAVLQVVCAHGNSDEAMLSQLIPNPFHKLRFITEWHALIDSHACTIADKQITQA